MKKTLSRSAYAKINLYLHVGNKRPDGYHSIESIMQTVSLSDIVTVTCDTDAHERRVSLTCSDESVPCDENNIAVKCALGFFGEFGINSYSVDIHIEKRIPVSGGLAGGSTDGAAILAVLSEIYGVGDEATLMKLGGRIGADIPFCLRGGCAVCTGIGDVLDTIEAPSSDYCVLIASPGGGVSTPEAYRLIDEAGVIVPSCTLESVARSLEAGRAPSAMHNDFEAVILPRNPNAARVRSLMHQLGASCAMMSGSGPTVFGLFETPIKCESAASELRALGITCSVCRPVIPEFSV